MPHSSRGTGAFREICVTAVEIPYRVLFLCTGNSARSIMAEALLADLGAGRFSSFSAGSQPTGVVNPLALETLDSKGVPCSGPRCKSWDRFCDAAPMDFIITVCDQAAAEACPAWPGRPCSAHWGLADPATVGGTVENQLTAFADAFEILERRVSEFATLPIDTLDPATLAQELRRIGTT